MSAKRITMRQLRELLRLRYEAKLSMRQINASTKISIGKIQSILKQAEQLNLQWPLPDDMDDRELAQKFYPQADTRISKNFQQPDWSVVHQELKKKGLTRQLLWEEYTQQYPNSCYSYSQYCDRYEHWRKQQKRSMRQTHRAGEKLFIDYCGPTVPIVDRHTGEIKEAQIFVAVFGASNYTFAEATASQKLKDWLYSHVRAFNFFDGLPELLIPDNLRSGVSKACRYEPELNLSYQQLAAHYQVVVIPARPYKPKDKSKAEVGVQIVERWIIARLRHQTFFSLHELNQSIKALLVDLNSRPFKKLPGNRLQAFEQIDKPALKPLPRHAYEYTEIKIVKVNIDYHIEYEQHFYSVPHHLVGETLELHAGDKVIQMFFKNKLITTHVRKYYPGTSTESSHMPTRHEKHHKWSPGRLMNWGKDIGPDVLIWVKQRLNEKAHPEQAYRVCLGLLNLSRSYDNQRLNRACQIANKKSLNRLKNIRSILTSNLDKLPTDNVQKEEFDLEETLLPQSHKNIRGPKDYH